MKITHVLTIGGVLVGAAAARAQEPPPPPPVQSAPVTQTATPTPVPAATPALITAPTTTFTPQELRSRREAIFLMEGVLMKSVNLAAQLTADEIKRIEPALSMFSTAPVKAHGTLLEDYGVFFEVEIPSVIPSVASLVETIARDRRGRPSGLPAQPAALTGSADPTSAGIVNPDAHYVESVKQQLIIAMIMHSAAMELRPHEWLTVTARDGSEAPGQIGQPSTLTLRIKGADLADFYAGRITRDEVRKRVQVRGF